MVFFGCASRGHCLVSPLNWVRACQNKMAFRHDSRSQYEDKFTQFASSPAVSFNPWWSQGDPGRHFVTPFGRTWMQWERPGVQQTSPEWIMSLIMRYGYCPSVDMNTFSVLQCVCDHEMNRSEEEEVAELPSNSSFSIVGSIVSFVVTLYFIFPPLESRRTHRRTITMWIWWYYGKREEINSNWINSYEGIHRTESRSFI